jgi:hypothetical protein
MDPMVDPGIVIDTIFADAGSQQDMGYLGPAETRRISDKEDSTKG